MNNATVISASADFANAVESAKLQALYNFAYGLSHEINNPLANIATRAQTLLSGEKDPERRRKLAVIVQQAFRAHEMIADLMLFARPPAVRRAETDLAEVAERVVSEVRDQAAEQGSEVIYERGPALLTTVDATQIAVALKAVVQNALEAVQTGGRIAVNVSSSAEQSAVCTFKSGANAGRVSDSGPQILLSVMDNGPGIPAEVRPHIFDPFFCGREAGRGLGLGLSKAWRIANLHGGYIDVQSEDGRGTTMTIVLPIGSR